MNAENNHGKCSECEFFLPVLSLKGVRDKIGWCQRAQFVSEDTPSDGRRAANSEGTCDDFSRCWWIDDKGDSECTITSR